MGILLTESGLQGNLHKRLVVLTSTTEDPRHSTLTTATAGAKELGETVQGIVFDLLMHKVRLSSF